MAKKIVAVTGSYQKEGYTNSLVDAVLDAAGQAGASVVRIDLIEKNIEFCSNCRSCSQEPGRKRGVCVKKDDMDAILDEIESADALVLASPVNMFNVTAVFRKFMERLTPYSYWPWGGPSPKFRITKPEKKAILIACSAMPGFLIPLLTGARKALATPAKIFGAKPETAIMAGMAARELGQKASGKPLAKARRAGARLAA